MSHNCKSLIARCKFTIQRKKKSELKDLNIEINQYCEINSIVIFSQNSEFTLFSKPFSLFHWPLSVRWRLKCCDLINYYPKTQVIFTVLQSELMLLLFTQTAAAQNSSWMYLILKWPLIHNNYGQNMTKQINNTKSALVQSKHAYLYMNTRYSNYRWSKCEENTFSGMTNAKHTSTVDCMKIKTLIIYHTTFTLIYIKSKLIIIFHSELIWKQTCLTLPFLKLSNTN